MNVLVTGGCGFIGSNLVRLLFREELRAFVTTAVHWCSQADARVLTTDIERADSFGTGNLVRGK